MKINIVIKGLLVYFLCLTISSCNRYIDIVKSSDKIPVKHGGLNFYTDSNVFVYKSRIGLRRDQEIIYPKAFSISLPKGIKYYEFINSTDFAFYYDKNQVVYLNIDLDTNKKVGIDTLYSPSENELNGFIQYKTLTSGNKYDIKKIPIHNKRKQAIIKKKDATIILYNIMPENYTRFYDQVSKFTVT